MKRYLPLVLLAMLIAVSPGLLAQNFNIKAVLGSFPTGGQVDNWQEAAQYFNLDARSASGSGSGLNAALEFGVYLIPDLSLALGIGYQNKELVGGKGVFSYPDGSGHRGGFSLQPHMTATLYPVTATLSYAFYLSDEFSLVVSGGAGYYFGDVKSFSDYLDKEPSTSDLPFGYLSYYYQSDIAGIGYHGGIGLDITLSENTLFVVEVFYRHLEIDDPETQLAIGGTPFEVDDTGQEGSVFMYSYLLSGEGPEDIVYRISTLNFSGFQIKAGIKFRF